VAYICPLQHTATHRKALQHTSTHYNKLHSQWLHTATRYKTYIITLCYIVDLLQFNNQPQRPYPCMRIMTHLHVEWRTCTCHDALTRVMTHLHVSWRTYTCHVTHLQCNVACVGCCGVLQCVAMSDSATGVTWLSCSALQWRGLVAVYCSVLRCVAVCCSVL